MVCRERPVSSFEHLSLIRHSNFVIRIYVAMRTFKWLILIVLQAAAVAWAYTAITHLLSSSPNQQMLQSQYGPTSQPMSLALQQINREQLVWGKQALFSVASCFLVLMFVLITWVTDGRPPRQR